MRQVRSRMDEQLVIRAQDGDQAAFAMLAVEVGPRFHAVAYRILRDVSLAEDAVQQALLDAWQDLPRLREPERFSAWSYRLLIRAWPASMARRGPGTCEDGVCTILTSPTTAWSGCGQISRTSGWREICRESARS